MIPAIEKRVFERIDFTNKQLRIRKKYVDDGLDTPIFKKNEIIQIFKDLGYACNYTVGGSYLIAKTVSNYRFECNFIVSKNSVNIYYYIYCNNKFIENRVTNIGSVLRYIPYDNNLITDSYGLNSSAAEVSNATMSCCRRLGFNQRHSRDEKQIPRVKYSYSKWRSLN